MKKTLEKKKESPLLFPSSMIFQLSDLLDSTAHARGSLKIHCQPIYAREYLAKISPVLNLQHWLIAKEKNIEFIIESEKNMSKNNIDENRLNQVVVNLLTNAFKYTQAGTVKLQAFQRSEWV